MRKIQVKNLDAEKIVNSAGVYSIQVNVRTDHGTFSASVPEGTSKGKAEAKRYNGSIDNAIKTVKTIISKQIKQINGLSDILKIEKTTSKYGSVVCLAVTFGLLKALAGKNKIPVWKLFKPKKKVIPKPLNKMLGGGKHAGKDSPTIQEFLVLGKSKSIGISIKNNLRIHSRIKETFQPEGKDLEGGWVLNVTDKNAFKILKRYSGNKKIGADFAASSYYDSKTGFYNYKNDEKLTREAQINRIVSWQKEFRLYYIEDPLHEDDFEGFAELTKKLGKKSLIVGDDLLATNPERLKKAIYLGACNSCIVKPDQIGSLTGVIEFVKIAKQNKYVPVISHRSGETNDDILADLAVGLEIPIIKIGIVGGERVAKLNRLVEINKEK